ncbi:ganglioside GM2 activator-like [Stegodyphus dumicola]|uniref:ganglioside GM2 activator-like n=1 Tax=Stegodyphus dumicola TaxID=202533 RepID=UPI0015B1BADB|nr:ganglioside GM2 activator-like [Stegodyphus dumicola]
MKCLLFIALICIFMMGNPNILVNGVQYRDCLNGNGIARITNFNLLPNPLSFSKNITASLSVQLDQDIPPGTAIISKVYKITWFFGLKVIAPCINNVGSCTEDHCAFLKKYGQQLCPFFPKDRECKCPIKAGSYSGNEVTIPMPDLGAILKWFASGKFQIEMRLRDINSRKDLACFEFTGEIKP